jgi:hypothetical protein
MSKRVVQANTRANTRTVEQRQTISPQRIVPQAPPQRIHLQNVPQAPPQRIHLQNAQRERPKVPVFSSPTLISQIKSFTQYPDKHYYLGFGGLGDAILLMAVCWDNPKAKVVFFANHIPFIRTFFELLGISLYIHENIMGTKMAAHIFDYMKALPTFKQSAHLADGLDFNDWANESKYISRIKGKVNWIGHLGKQPSDKPVVIIAPSGSHKATNRQRYLHNGEYEWLVHRYLDKGYKVYVAGSMNDLHHFKLIDRPNFYWLNSDRIYDGKGIGKQSNLLNMLRIVNSAEHVVSMDTWLKTYTLICGIPTTVIKTRWDGIYKSYGEDITDYIFLNSNIWPHLTLIKWEELFATL